MQTLIELYDERPLENVLGAEVFRPEQVVYVCPESAFRNHRLKQKLQNFFTHRGIRVKLLFEKVSVFDAEAVLCLLRRVVEEHPDCAMDITGGTDAVLFAAGLLSAEKNLPAFTYSRRKNSFYDIRHADFARALPCKLAYTVEDQFLMAGGAMRQGRVDNEVLAQYLDLVEPFFRFYLRRRRGWTTLVTYIQRLSPTGPEGEVDLQAKGRYTVKGERGNPISAPEDALRELEQIGMLQELEIVPDETVSFRFPDGQIRAFLRDVGSVLELYVYKACLDLGCFDDVRLSAIVDWEGENRRGAVSNELDVVCTKGVIPFFISCKTCDAKTESLNELAILRDRFGGEMARSAIVTAERAGAALRNRAAELNISVIDLSDLTAGRLPQRLRRLIGK